jgi:hypothetical protein
VLIPGELREGCRICKAFGMCRSEGALEVRITKELRTSGFESADSKGVYAANELGQGLPTQCTEGERSAPFGCTRGKLGWAERNPAGMGRDDSRVSASIHKER